MYGIELYEWNPNGHDGGFEDIKYFDVPRGYGFFAKSDFITGKIVDRVTMEPINVIDDPTKEVP
eukprot:CAMPEP_0201590110 /NCGR_PEP_ID=MMETSP0190_2-20130828/174260_1 /ASSEMBLY_ACC=CAM_ASM_000263 /TAXON_ID=37353 /ORGANISM="Rosalina sp." /LENGTH=63 /DNA_ID=CAMNT_0048045585 /DNA_START=94 /DNA_END=281 /DNA_ORIENTATION=+